jgi:hypothetical protein
VPVPTGEPASTKAHARWPLRVSTR